MQNILFTIVYILLSGGWLNDSLVNAAEALIKEAYPHINGFQDVSLGHTLGFDISRGEFVQVLHTRLGHWVAISTIGCQQVEVDVFDSMAPSLTKKMELQLAALRCTNRDAITVR